MKIKKVLLELAMFEDDFNNVSLRVQFGNSDRIIHSAKILIEPRIFDAVPFDVLFEQAYRQLKKHVKEYYNTEMNKVFDNEV